MILYHGSNIDINNIDLSKCRPYKDFGKGFYLTAIKSQSEKMAERVARIYGGTPVITAFEFDKNNIPSSINVKNFNNPTEEWAKFVINNRNKNFTNISDVSCNSDFKYDIVIGPVANDDLALLFRQFTIGYINIETLVNEMKYKKLTNQYSFHTQRAVSLLKRIGVIND